MVARVCPCLVACWVGLRFWGRVGLIVLLLRFELLCVASIKKFHKYDVDGRLWHCFRWPDMMGL